MKKKYILALDAGTSSTRAVVFDQNANIISVAKKSILSYHQKPGWVEQDADEIWRTQLFVAQQAVREAGLRNIDISAIGITNQRETTILWNKQTGRPVYSAISWQSRQSDEICQKMKADGMEEEFRQKTSLVIHPYFSASKIRWILDHVPEAAKLAKKGELLFGTVDTWLMWKLSCGQIFATDYSNASRTMLYHLRKLRWDKTLLRYMDIPAQILPEVRSSSEIYGYTDPSILGCRIPIAGVLGNQQADLFGQSCFEAGMAKNTYGEGSFFLLNTGAEFVQSRNGAVTTIAWGIDKKITYALEGSVFAAGSAIAWLKNGLGMLKDLTDSEWIARQVNNTGGVYFVPAFRGMMGAPYWDVATSGMIIGLQEDTEKAHIVRAALAAMAYQVRDVLEAIESDASLKIEELRVDGGGSRNQLLLQMQADVLGIPVRRAAVEETTALGVAYMAGMAIGLWPTQEDLRALGQEGAQFLPRLSEKERDELYDGWQNAVSHTIRWRSP